MIESKRNLNVIYSILVMGALFVFGAFYNGFPLVTSDTGSYITHAYLNTIPDGRPIGYSIWIKIFSLRLSLWLPIIAQGVTLAFLVYQIMKVLFHDVLFNSKVYYFFASLIIFLTPVTWCASQLMPDIFSAILLLSLFLWFYDDNKLNRIIYSVLIFGSAQMHHSHLFSLLAFSSLLLIYSFFKSKDQIRRSIIMLAFSFFSLIFAGSLHFFAGHGFTLSKRSHVFLLGKMCENGMLQKYLAENCGSKDLKICEFQHSIPNAPWAFIWNEDGPMRKMGGWDATKEEYDYILKDMITSPKYILALGLKSIEHTGRQLAAIGIGDGLNAHGDKSNIFWKVQEHFSHEEAEFLTSKQNISRFRWDAMNGFYYISLSIIVLLGLFYNMTHSMSKRMKIAFSFFFTYAIINAFVTANLANVLARLQTRIMWILPMLIILYIGRIYLLNKAQKEEEIS